MPAMQMQMKAAQERRQQQLQQRQQSVNAQSYLGVPEQLMVMEQHGAELHVQQQRQLSQPQLQPQVKAGEPPKPKEPQGWECPQCTLVNNPRRPGCELCSAPRPEDYVVPEEAPLAEFERKAKENEALFEQVLKRYLLQTEYMYACVL